MPTTLIVYDSEHLKLLISLLLKLSSSNKSLACSATWTMAAAHDVRAASCAMAGLCKAPPTAGLS